MYMTRCSNWLRLYTTYCNRIYNFWCCRSCLKFLGRTFTLARENTRLDQKQRQLSVLSYFSAAFRWVGVKVRIPCSGILTGEIRLISVYSNFLKIMREFIWECRTRLRIKFTFSFRSQGRLFNETGGKDIISHLNWNKI